jgi:hypothetical protein
MMPRSVSPGGLGSVGAHDVVDEPLFGGQYRVVDVRVDGQDDRGASVAGATALGDRAGKRAAMNSFGMGTTPLRSGLTDTITRREAGDDPVPAGAEGGHGAANV